jgi:hypothetical protein
MSAELKFMVRRQELAAELFRKSARQGAASTRTGTFEENLAVRTKAVVAALSL